MTQVTLNNGSVDSAGSLLLKTNGTTTAVTIDTAQNMGLGVTPSAWDTSNTTRALQVSNGPSIYGFNIGGASPYAWFGSNDYRASGGTNRYVVSASASAYYQNGGAHYWLNAASGTAGNAITFTQAMTLDASGNLLVNDTSVSALGGSIRQVQIKGNTSSRGGGVRLLSSDSSLDGYMYVADGLCSIGTGTSTPISFVTGATERARIDSSGKLLVGVTSAGGETANLQIGGDANTMRVIPSVDNTGYVGQATKRWSAIYAVTGTIQTSDGREKNTIENSVLGLDFVNTLRPVSYKWNVGANVVTADEEGNQVVTPRAGTRTHFGFIAQEVKEALGEQDFGGYVQEEDGRLGLRYDQFIAPLVKAIQEQQALITSLTARIEALEA